MYEVLIKEKGIVLLFKEDYEKLLEAQRRLEVLEYWGVDNWEGYHHIYDNKED